jgi:hypothetical protein
MKRNRIDHPDQQFLFSQEELRIPPLHSPEGYKAPILSPYPEKRKPLCNMEQLRKDRANGRNAHD